MSSPITTHTSSGIASIVIDHPPVNALAPDAWAAIADAVQAAHDDTDVRAVTLAGPPGRFCAGADIGVLTQPGSDADADATMLDIVADACSAIRRCRVPVVAGIDGAAHGGGLELALSCDIRIASPRATFAASGINMGLVASVGSLYRAIGDTRARHMLLTGLPVSADRALDDGLISTIDDDPVEAARALAELLASKAPLSLEANKALLALASTGASHDDFEATMRDRFSLLRATADHREALAAFLEKRSPSFERR